MLAFLSRRYLSRQPRHDAFVRSQAFAVAGVWLRTCQRTHTSSKKRRRIFIRSVLLNIILYKVGKVSAQKLVNQKHLTQNEELRSVWETDHFQEGIEFGLGVDDSGEEAEIV